MDNNSTKNWFYNIGAAIVVLGVLIFTVYLALGWSRGWGLCGVGRERGCLSSRRRPKIYQRRIVNGRMCPRIVMRSPLNGQAFCLWNAGKKVVHGGMHGPQFLRAKAKEDRTGDGF